MGYARKLEDEDDDSSSSRPLNETLLIATMCIIGLQVHVHVKDGSVFSGVFYTASFENGFGIVLKNAKMTKKGKSKANVASGSVVETLVIMSPNIVQVVAEGVSLPTNVTGNNESEVVGSAVETLPSKPRLSAANKSKKHGTEGRGNHHRRQPGANILKRNEHIPDVHQEDIQISSSSLDNMAERVKPIEEAKLMPKPISNGFHDAAERLSSTDNSSSPSTTVDETSELLQGLEASPNESVPIQAVKAKEFKLNPEAKNFCPSYTKRLSPSPAAIPDIGNTAYMPSNTPVQPVYPEVGNNPYIPHTIPPSKFVPYANLTPGNTVGGFNYPQHMMGPTVNRAETQRFTSPYQSVQASPMFVNPNPQVMVARSGQLVYVQPVSQNLVQATPPLPPMLSCPLAPAQHVQYLKHQSGVVAAGHPPQLCVPQPFTTGGVQPYGVPAQFPAMQPPPPFLTNQPMHIAVPNGFYGPKFP
ncbi:polyadenylate-binding protein-interacting protein 4-like [Raphanus sativus]|uniref:Polyadenylate-binding protein-interacting protein 4-like n=1 Tax=Raphanus sativus TaxID=3726 RepID=A0A9W3DIX7_RAPSA|nr:polyadenylate-binding protein-interacting protein 4-like [Raphanus sativus]XP_056863393.1 polyadenylate-binding protein-interacting protein 4-like [Raphanus sativus]